MAYIVADGCTKDGECVAACVTDSITIGTFTDEDGTVYDQAFINPETCIDCGNCESACPQATIYADTDLPADKAQYERINRVFHAQ